MSNVYDELVEYAEVLVKIINEKYITGNSVAYLPLLSGIGSCRVESYPGAGHNYQAVIDAMNNYYKRDIFSLVNMGFQEGIHAMIRYANNFVSVQNIVNLLFYQLRKESDGSASFNIDKESIFHSLSDNILKNRSSYEYENKNFAEWLERVNMIAISSYGIELV